MKILVAGGCGYVGRTLVRQLYDEHDVYVLDNLRSGTRLTDRDRNAVQLLNTDLRDGERVRKEVENVDPDVIVHLAAIHYIPECEQQPGLAVETNVTGTVQLLSACPPDCRFVFTSSAAVYAPSTEPHREQDELPSVPDDVYGATKLQGEQFTRYFARARGFPAVIVRLFNVVGPGETNPHLVPEIAAQVLAGKSKIQLGNTGSERDFIHVDDAAAGFRQLALHPDLGPGEPLVVNLGSGQPRSVRQAVQMLSEISGRSIEIEVDPARLRPVDRPVLCADLTRLRSVLGWSPRPDSLRSALEDLWRNPDLPPELLERYRR